MVTASYPGGIIQYTTKKDRIDVVDDDHINQPQAEQIAMQTYVGTNPHGDRGSIADRLNAQFDGSGFLLGSNGFPVDTTPRKMWYRNDEESFYIAKSDGSGFGAIGQNFSNVIFVWSGIDQAFSSTGSGWGLIESTSLSAGVVKVKGYKYFTSRSTSFQNILPFRWTKIAGINTITLHSRLWRGSSIARLQVDIGGVTGTASSSGTAPAWVTGGALDVSGLVNGSVYNCMISLKNDTNDAPAYCSAINLTAS